jgi:hypothetical protein
MLCDMRFKFYANKFNTSFKQLDKKTPVENWQRILTFDRSYIHYLEKHLVPKITIKINYSISLSLAAMC